LIAAAVTSAALGGSLPASPAPSPLPGAALSEPARWLQGYLRLDTTNPPGNERIAVAYLASILTREGIPVQQWVSPAGRVSLSARLRSGRSDARALLLLHHMDVVAPGPGWSAAPFGATVRDERLWGRGAVDDKSLGIAQLAALVAAKRRHLPLERDLLWVAVPDEESGGGEGTAWLIARHPELFADVEAVIGEGGLNLVSSGRLRWWGVEVAQKRPLWLEVTASGRGGHGSGLNPESANHQLIAALDRLLQLPPRWQVTAPARAYLAALAPLHNEHWRRIFSRIDQLIDERRGPREFLLPGMASLFLDTVQVTVLAGGDRINVIPERATARIDIRLLPDTPAPAFLDRVREALGKDLDVRVLVTSPPAAASPGAGVAWSAISRTLAAEGPVVPAVIAGFTDSRFFRERGIPAYGVSPFALAGEDLRGIHAADERIPVAELDRGVERMVRIAAAYAATPNYGRRPAASGAR
jgi:acetylornithine deacetylase/succinyl-diaminopimelate desuccinylase-like protein